MLRNLWHLISSLGPDDGLKTYLDLLVVDSKGLSPECQMLHLFCEATTHLVTYEFHPRFIVYCIHCYNVIVAYVFFKSAR